MSLNHLAPMQAREASGVRKQPSSASQAPQDNSMGSGDFSEAQPLMNGQHDSLRRSEPGSGSHPLAGGGANGERGRNGEEINLADQELLGQQTMDFWLILCICHTLIVEQDKNGGPLVYQVHTSSHADNVSVSQQRQVRECSVWFMAIVPSQCTS